MILSQTAEWHDARRRTVGGSEVSALFGVHPFMTYFNLYCLKLGLIEEQNLEGLEAIQKGRFLEDGVAQWAAWREGYVVRRHQGFVPHPRVPGWSVTPDYRCASPWRDGEGTMEVKVTGFVDNDECPAYYAIQLHSQLACEGKDWGVVACLSASPRTRLLTWEFERSDTVTGRIEAAIDEFWRRVRERDEPPPDYYEDGDLIARIYNRHVEGAHRDLGQDNYAIDLCARLLEARAAEKAAREEKEAVQAELIHKLGGAMTGRAGPYHIRSVVVSASPPKIITSSMIGDMLPGRAGSRHLRIKEKD